MRLGKEKAGLLFFNLRNKIDKCTYAECVCHIRFNHQHVSVAVMTIIRVTCMKVRNANNLSKRECEL